MPTEPTLNDAATFEAIKEGGTLTLGNNNGKTDTVKLDVTTSNLGATTVTDSAIRAVANFGKATSAASTDGADKFDFAAAQTLLATNAGAHVTVTNGVATFDEGVTTLTAAVTALSTAAGNTANQATAFQYNGEWYLFSSGTTGANVNDDVVVKLAGIGSVSEVVVDANNDLILV